MTLLRRLLSHPLTRGIPLDDPRTSLVRRRIVQQKSFLRQIYQEWYASISAALPAGSDRVLELGSGGGFLHEYIPGLITSDVLFLPGLRVVLDAPRLPFADSALHAVVMTNVFHHLSDVRAFLSDAGRCVRPGGVLVMIEPWVTAWSRFVYGLLHHEPFVPSAPAWEFSREGPLTSANGALAWIIFERDRRQFEREFPQWRIVDLRPGMPFRYLVSGGVSLRALMPGWTFNAWKRLETALDPSGRRFAMFARVVLARAGDRRA